MVSPLPCLRAASAAQRREAAVDMRCRCVGPPTTSRSAAATSSGVARVTGTSVTSCLVLRPAAMLTATACVLPYIDS